MANNKNKEGIAIQSYWTDNRSIFAALYQHSSDLHLFQEKLKAKLPSPLSDHFVLANIDKKTLTIHTDSPAWAARLRFMTPDILNHAREICSPYAPQTIRIKVTLPIPTIKKSPTKMNLSAKSAQLILETANSITDPELRNALIRLSRHKQ
jgi:hypothetical protein